MSTILVITPIIIASWPAITAAVAATVGTMGFVAAKQGEVGFESEAVHKTRAEIEVDDSEILAEAAGGGEEIVVQREGITAIFSRDARGALRVCMEGTGVSKRELRQIGQELIDRVTQQYVYHRIVTELKDRKMAIVEEEMSEDRTVKIRVRNW